MSEQHFAVSFSISSGRVQSQPTHSCSLLHNANHDASARAAQFQALTEHVVVPGAPTGDFHTLSAGSYVTLGQ
eukprot:1453700-Rhodomonas_salina.1